LGLIQSGAERSAETALLDWGVPQAYYLWTSLPPLMSRYAPLLTKRDHAGR
jgi:hypothetical protein